MVHTIDLSHGTVIVSGGNRGIGLALSEAAANCGANVAILYRSHPKAQEAAAEVAKKYGTQVKAYQCDVADHDLVLKTIEQAAQDLQKPIIGLVANAGVSVVKPALELTREDYEYVYNTNVFGVFNTCQAMAKHWKQKGAKGSIIVTSSMSSEVYNQKGLSDPLTQVFYNSSKSAATGIVRGLSAEWAPLGIRVNALEPGFCNTEQTSGMDASIREFQAKSVPLGRFSEPHEQAGPAMMLLSDAASYITGSQLRIDGGFTVW